MGRNARRRAEKKTDRASAIKPTRSEQGAAGAVALVEANPTWAANRIAELERAMQVNYGLLRVLVDRAGGEIRIPRDEWQGSEAALKVEHDDEMNVTLRVASAL